MSSAPGAVVAGHGHRPADRKEGEEEDDSTETVQRGLAPGDSIMRKT